MVRLTRFMIKNFKSLLDVEISLPLGSPVTFLIGLNGSGKSTILQAFDFAGELMRGNILDWLDKRGWHPADLVTRIHSSRRRTLIEVTLEGVVGENNKFSWQAVFNPNPSYLRCTSERLTIEHIHLSNTSSQSMETGHEDIDIDVQLKDGKLSINKNEQDITFTYFGSVLSQLSIKNLSAYPPLLDVCDGIASIHSFDLLSPRNIRGRSRKSRTIGMSGESLSGYIASLDSEKQGQLIKYLRDFYPWIYKIGIKGFPFGWKELRIIERIGRYHDPNTDEYHSYILARSSQHINDGTLRLLSIMAVILFQNGITLFDEIENGFNPHIISKLVNLLFTSSSQLIITTHSPEILQYIDIGKIAKSVKFIYRKEDATTGITDFFDIPDVKQKSRILSPGEAFLDIDLGDLSRTLDKQEKMIDS